MLKLNKVNTFIGRKKIIRDATFQINAGEIVGLIGPNGAGKTTIMKTILGLTRFEGSIEIAGKIVTENNHTSLEQVGALIEHPAIYPFLSGTENLRLYSQDETDMSQVIHLLQMDDFIYKKAKSYSLGMKQKLGIAIALLNKPKLVILDEPMNGLDLEATILVRKIIKSYAQSGTSFLISSHILGELQKIMTDVILIKNGQIIVDKSVDEFNKVRQKEYLLKVNDVNKATELLSSNKIEFSQQEDIVLIKKESLFVTEDILFDGNIKLLEVSPFGASFEQVVVKLLEKRRGN